MEDEREVGTLEDFEVRIGAHISSAGSFPRAADNAASLGLNCVQFFTRNPRGGRQRRLCHEEVQQFRSRLETLGLDPVVMHAPYSVNLASEKAQVVEFSRRVVAEDLQRCCVLASPYLVLHPGNRGGQTLKEGLSLVIEGLEYAVSRAQGAASSGTRLLLEFMSGRGNEVGSTLEEMAEILDGVECPDSIGFCLDTCHCFARGYPVDEVKGLDMFLRSFDDILGLDRLAVVHLNDSLESRGSRRDRHAPLGEGQLGARGMGRIVSHELLRDLPFIMEVPVEEEGEYTAQADMVRRWHGSSPDVRA